MPRKLRFVPPEGAVVEVTTRTIQGRLLLRPNPELSRLILGILGRAQRLYSVEIHAFVFMSNHFHLLLSVRSALQLARFMGYLNGNLAKEVVRRTGWTDKVWSRRYQAVLVSDEEAAQVGRLRYLLAHGTKENLVARPRDWPGVSSVHALLDGAELKGRWFDRTRESSARRRGVALSLEESSQIERVHLSPLPCWAEVAPATRTAWIEEIVRGIEADAVKLRRTTGKAPLGAAKVLRQRPFNRPHRPDRSPAPFAHCSSRKSRKLLREAYCWFLSAYREASRRLERLGASSFPEGCFPPPAPFVGLAVAPAQTGSTRTKRFL